MSSNQDLTVPFTIPIPGGLQPGKMIVVQGAVPPMSQRFEVNLLTGSGDIAFHLCPKFKENRVVRNSVEHMMWGEEETNGSMPVFPGQNFDLTILCEPFDFKVAFGGRHFTEFKHRSPFSTIKELSVEGDVVVSNVNFKEVNNYANNSNSSSTTHGLQAGGPANYNSSGLYPSNITEHFSNTDGPKQPPKPAYPTQPSSGNLPHQIHYPRVPDLPTDGFNSNSGGYNPPPPGFYNPQSGGGYNPQPGGYNPQSGGGYNPQPGGRYSPQPGGRYSPQPGGRYSPQPGYNPQPTGYSPYPGYNPQAGGYNPQPSGYNPQSDGYNPHSGGYNPQSGGHNSSSNSKSGFLDQAGMALAGIIGSGLLAGGMNKKPNTTGCVKSTLLDQAGRALAGVFRGSGLSGNRTSQRGMDPQSQTTRTNSGFLDQAGSALAGILGGSGLAGNGHHNRNKVGGVLGGTLGTAIAGAALTGHLNPVEGLTGIQH